MSCGRQFCGVCHGELIHRDRKKPWESSSGIGQIISRCGPVAITTGDLDQYVRVWTPASTLLRFVEHSWPDAPIKGQQDRFLADLSRLVAHAIECPSCPLSLDSRSGVFVVRGEILVADTSQRRTELGPQTLYRMDGDGTLDRLAEFTGQEEFFCWLEGKRGGRRRQKSLGVVAA